MSPNNVHRTPLYKELRRVLPEMKEEILRELKQLARHSAANPGFFVDWGRQELLVAFPWEDSPQGFGYWNYIYILTTREG